MNVIDINDRDMNLGGVDVGGMSDRDLFDNLERARDLIYLDAIGQERAKEPLTALLTAGAGVIGAVSRVLSRFDDPARMAEESDELVVPALAIWLLSHDLVLVEPHAIRKGLKQLRESVLSSKEKR